MPDRTLLLVGCGRMGGALMKRWVENPPASVTDFWVIEPHSPPIAGLEDNWVSDLEFLPHDVRPNIIVLGTKPQMLSSVLPNYNDRFGTQPLYVSIAAGKTLKFYHNHLGEKARIVRVMPNTPALIGKGVSALCAKPKLSALSKKMATELMEAVGEVVWVKDDALMDAVTGISGSGPAYVFLFLESLVQAGVDAGLSETLARQLAIGTVIGAGELAKNSDEELSTLRENVTSPGGTTEAALEELMDEDRLKKLVKKAVDAAIARSKVLI